MLRRVIIENDFNAWRDTARMLLVQGVRPQDIAWADDSQPDLLDGFGQTNDSTAADPKAIRISPAFIGLAKDVACHRDPERWSLMYRLAWRLTHGEPHLLDVVVDDDVYAFLNMQRAVRRDRHKMSAFVRFRKVDDDTGGERYVAWHRPDHFIVRTTVPFFVKRFGVMNWSILTPDACAHWDPESEAAAKGSGLVFSPGASQDAAPLGDDLEELWKTYYANIFNPARIKMKAMRKEMPVRHWGTLPETQLIPDLLKDAPRRVEAMIMATRGKTKTASGEVNGCTSTGTAADFLPRSISLPTLREAAATCRGCELYCHATQVVFGEGPTHAACMMIGEQPGDQEDLAGRPFVGPAGQLLDELLQQAGVPRDEVYVTNAVKHFKFEPRGTRRIHAKPSAREVKACRPWLEAEIAAVKPKMIVCLGATAAQSLFGAGFRITQSRGELIETEFAPWATATLHPSALLRIPDETMREQAFDDVRADLRKVAEQLQTYR